MATGLADSVIAAGMAGKARADKVRMVKAALTSAGMAAKAWAIAMPMTGAAREWAVRAWGLKGRVVPAEVVEAPEWMVAESEAAARMDAVALAGRAAQASVSKAIKIGVVAPVSAGAMSLAQVSVVSAMARGSAAPKGEVGLAGEAQGLTDKAGKTRAMPVQAELTHRK